MSNFLITSLVASVVLTVLVNLIPRLFPRASRAVERKVVETVQDAEARDARGEGRMRVFFPWKFMLLASIVLTVLVNLIALVAR